MLSKKGSIVGQAKAGPPVPDMNKKLVNWNSRIRPLGEAPWLDYDDTTQEDLLARFGDLSEENRARVLQYEESRDKPRKGIIEALGGTVEETSHEADDRKSAKKYDWVTPTK